MNERYTLAPIRIHIHLKSEVSVNFNLYFAHAADL